MKLKNLKVLAESGMLMATALALSLMKFIQLPVGGSISFSCLALILIGARHGLLAGIISGASFGFLLLMNNPYIVHPVQFLLDYPLAYAAFGIAGAVKWESPIKTVTATTVANIIRLHFHVVAGALFFMTDKNTAMQAVIASYTYNLCHLLPETIACGLFAVYLIKYKKELCERQ